MDRPVRSGPALFGLLAAPPAAWLTAFFLAPMAIIWAYSLGENVSLTQIVVDGSLGAYSHAFQPLYLRIIGKSLIFAAITTAFCLVIGFPVAVAMAFARPRTKAWLLLLVMLPFWTNLLIRTYALMAVLRTEGYVNLTLGWAWRSVAALMAFVGVQASPFHPLVLLHTDGAVVLGLVYVQLPFMILPLYATLDRLDRSLLEAGLDLGASQIGAFARIVAPMAAPGMVSGIVLTLIPSVGAYLTPDLLGGPSSLMIANVIERQFRSADDWPFGAALSFLLIYLTLICVAAQALAARPRPRRRG
jgi:spermidine/putrescine transport system permease protein